MNFKQIGGNSWVILSPIEQSIKKKIESAGVPLKDWDIQIYRGVLTGYNDAFIISSEKRDEILSNCKTASERKKSAELIRPILRGRDIKRYGFDWAELYLIALFPSKEYDIEDYPAVKKHLLEFDKERLIESGLDDIANNKNILHDYCRQRLEQAGKDIIINGRKVIINGSVQKSRKKTNNKWFETQDSISYLEDFFKPKIIFQEIVQASSFALDLHGNFFCNDTGRIIVGKNIKFLSAILNSNLFFFAIKYFYGGGGLGETGVRMKHTFFEKFCCVPEDKILTKLVDEIFIDNLDNQMKKINQRVYDLYGLSAEEISFIQTK